MTATTTDGKPARKQLSDQLDRLDTIIDALAEALPEAVADACREGARQAVKDAIIEVLTNPDLRALIAGPAAQPPADPAPAPARPGFWSRVKAGLAAARDAVVERCTAAAATVATTARTLTAVLPLWKLLAAGAGGAVWLATCVWPRGVSAVAGVVRRACAAAAATIGNWFRRSGPAVGFAGTG
jgi:hypothetical protein